MYLEGDSVEAQSSELAFVNHKTHGLGCRADLFGCKWVQGMKEALSHDEDGRPPNCCCRSLVVSLGLCTDSDLFVTVSR